MKIQALLLATIIASPATAEIINVHNDDGTVTRIETSRTVIDQNERQANSLTRANANINAQTRTEISANPYRQLTAEERAKLEATYKAPISVTERAHQRALERARASGSMPTLPGVEATAGVYQDPYSMKARTLGAPTPDSNQFYFETEGTRREDRSNAVETRTELFLEPTQY